MLKALIKKQLMEIFSFLFYEKGKGTRRNKGAVVGYSLLMSFLTLFLIAVFAFVGVMLMPLIAADMTWYYFGLMSLMALLFGVFGSVFNTYAGLYLARDNDLLLSLPVKPSYILAARATGVYITGLYYSATVMIPAVGVYFFFAPQNFVTVLFSLLDIFIVSLWVLALTCFFGWVVAKISVKLKSKSLITVAVSVVFMILYYLFYSKAAEMLNLLLENSSESGAVFKKWGWLLCLVGNIAEGDFISLVITLVVTAVLLFLCSLVLSRSLFKIATADTHIKQKKEKRKKSSQRSPQKALIYKEFKRFLASPVYMLNCGVSAVLMPIAAVFAVIKRDVVREILAELALSQGTVALILSAAACFMLSMIVVTAPSVSLEGKNLWILRSLPAEPRQILRAKLFVHLSVALVPAVPTVICIDIVCGLGVLGILLTLCTTVLFAAFIAYLGLMLNLKMPNFQWKDETVPVKTGMPVCISLFGGWALVTVFGVLYIFVGALLSSVVYLAVCCALLAAADVLMNMWINKKGSEIFSLL